MTSLANALEPSIRAAAADGPNTLRPCFLSSSASPATSGTSGPTTVRSTSCWSTKLTNLSTSSAATDGKHSALAAIPAFPGPRARASRSDPARDASTARARAPLPRPRGPSRAHHEALLARGADADDQIGTPPTSSRNRTYCLRLLRQVVERPHLSDLVVHPGSSSQTAPPRGTTVWFGGTSSQVSPRTDSRRRPSASRSRSARRASSGTAP